MSEPDDTPGEWMLGVEFRQRYRIPPSTFSRWRAAGRTPPAVKVGRHLRMRRDDVERWAAQNTSTRSGQR